MEKAIIVEDLKFKYPDGTAALKGISFAVAEGETVALIGPNGAGKSTVLLHLNGLLPEEPATTPNVFVFGEPVTKENFSKVRKTVGLLFQDPDDQLFCPTVFEDVAFGPLQFGLNGRSLDERVCESLAKVDLRGYEKRSPQHLSRGEKRRVCLAGILACEPQILVLDEPTSELDPRGKRELKSLLSQIHSTKVIATHDLELVVELCDRAVLLDRGELIATGPSKQLLSDDKMMLNHGLEKPHILRHSHPH